jgi:hypothetical protein
MKTKHLNWLQTNEACKESISWIQQNNIQSLEEAWNACERGDWLLWMATKLGIDERKLALCAALCAHTVIQYMQDSRSRNAVRIAFLWGRGKATDEELSSAGSAAWSAVFAAFAPDTDAWAAAVAAVAAAWAAVRSATLAAARSATSAADADKNRLRTAEIARKVLTEEVMKKLKEIK